MDIATLYSDTRTVTWPLAGGKASITVVLRPGNSDEAKAVDRAERKAVQEAARKGTTISPEKQDEFAARRLASIIESWEWPKGSTFDGREPDNSEEFKLFVINHHNPVAQEIVRRIGNEAADIEGFLPNAAKS